MSLPPDPPLFNTIILFILNFYCPKNGGNNRNARINREAYKSILKFNGSKNLTFKNITPTFLNKYEVHMRARGGTDGGIGVPMRALRALFNFAIERNMVKEEYYPFKIYKISKLKGKGLKKALSIEQVKKIVSLDLEQYPWLTNSRNFFAFSFYTRGMNFADMMKLEWKQIDDDKIYYTRSKTKGTFIIKIVPPVREILDFYKEQRSEIQSMFSPFSYTITLPPPRLQTENIKYFNAIIFN